MESVWQTEFAVPLVYFKPSLLLLNSVEIVFNYVICVICGRGFTP
jgi:hypothetical protein